jgi:transposase-like protein
MTYRPNCPLPVLILEQMAVKGLEALPEGLTMFNFPESHRRGIWTSNILEEVGQEIERGTREIRIIPN